LPFSLITKDKFFEYKEYHTSLDDINFIKNNDILHSFNFFKKFINYIEKQKIYLSLNNVEPFLSKYNLYSKISSSFQKNKDQVNLINIIDQFLRNPYNVIIGEMKIEFNKYEYLLTFDDKSYYTAMAGLCGTKSIILNPNPSLSPLEYRIQNPIQMCGVAYGINDIDWANKTIGLVRDNLLQLEKQDTLTISNFVNYWENKLK
jgi:hypothetical protein